MPLVVQRKEHGDAQRLYSEVVDSIQKGNHRLIELTCEKVEDKRITVLGSVETVKLQEHDYGVTWKMLLKSVDGYKLWGSIPAQMIEHFAKGVPEKLIGREFSFLCTVHRSDDDFFGYYKRPTSCAEHHRAEKVYPTAS